MPWGVLVHTTGRGVLASAVLRRKTPLEVAVKTYIDMQFGSEGYKWGGPTYVIDGGGKIAQLAPDDTRTNHCGGPNRAKYLSGEWRSLVPSKVLELWTKAWGPRPHPYSLFPSRSPNEDYCLDASTRVLTADLRWVAIGDLAVGDRLVGFHEDLRLHNTTVPTEVTYTARVVKPRTRVVTTHGELVCSVDHMFVGTLGQGGRARWLRADSLRAGSRLRYFVSPWSTDTSADGGWLSGMIDGEGCWVKKGELIVSQKIGPVLDKLISVLLAKGIDFVCRKRDKDDVCQVSMRGAGTGVEHVGRFRPVRMLDKAQSQWDGRRIYGKRTERPVVISVENISPGEVVAIKTTSRTFIAEGFLSHNCGIELIPTVTAGYTDAQLGALANLVRDIGERNKFPDGWYHGSRLVGHEDVDPISRSDRGGGWDPGALRDKPRLDFEALRDSIPPQG